jgi:hypothetical protein
VLSREGLYVSADPMKTALSSKQRQVAIEEVFGKAQKYVRGRMRERLSAALPTCSIEIYEPDDPSSCSLAVRFQSVLPPGPYIKEHVEIQCGARGDPEPCDDLPITPYVQADLGPGWNLGTAGVSIIRPERTFLEKLFLLHADAIAFDKGKTLADLNRRSRHYYDVAVMHERKIALRALADDGLMKRVRANQHIMWRKSREVVDSAKPGSFRIAPPKGMQAALRRDYEQMQIMMFGTPPSPDFDWVLAELQKLDDAVNKSLL